MTQAAYSARSAAPAPALDVERLRADFPILFREIYGKPLVYLDSGASAQKPKTVIEAMDHVMRFEYANVHRGIHFLSNAATQAYEDARETTRRFLGAQSVEEIVFTKNVTEAINLVAYSWGLESIKPGDEIVLSIMEHHSNIVPWHFLRERKGAVIKWAPISDTGEFLIEEFEALLTKRTRMVALTHMSNVTGTVVPIKDVIRIAHARGIPVLVDGAQGVVHTTVDVRDLDCDFYAFTGHKTYGPSGIGVLYGKKALLEKLPPFMGGGSMIESVTVDRVTYGTPPNRFEAGTPPIVEAIGLGAALNYMMQVGRAGIAAHERELTEYAHARLGELNWLKIHGTAPGKGGIVSFTMDGLHPHDISTIVDRSGVAIRAGHHCAQPLMERFGVPAMCRASFGLYNTKAEIDALAEALVKAHEFRVMMAGEHMDDDRTPAPTAGHQVVDLGHRPELDPSLAGTPPGSPPRPEHLAPAEGEARSTPVGGTTLSAEEIEQLTADIVTALKSVYDPEIPADIYELGLIYKIDIDDDRLVTVEMTLTAPGCPVAGEMPKWVENAVNTVPGVSGTKVNLTFDPPWDQSRMSEEARLAVGMF